MITFKRYPHVRDLLWHYANSLQETTITHLLSNNVTTEKEALELAHFVWRMADQMAIDSENKIQVLGRIDNSDLMPDVDYEIGLYLDSVGFYGLWQKVCDEN